MREINFGNVATFYSADETLVPDANYRVNKNHAQTRHTLDCLMEYFATRFGDSLPRARRSQRNDDVGINQEPG